MTVVTSPLHSLTQRGRQPTAPAVRPRTVPPPSPYRRGPLPQRAPAVPKSGRKKRSRNRKKLTVVTATTRTPVLESAAKAGEGKSPHTGSQQSCSGADRNTQRRQATHTSPSARAAQPLSDRE